MVLHIPDTPVIALEYTTSIRDRRGVAAGLWPCTTRVQHARGVDSAAWPALQRQVSQVRARVDEIAAELDRFTRYILDQGLNVHVDQVYVDKVNLDQMNFNIDGIGVEDLSGALSIGLNYGGRVYRTLTPSSGQPAHSPKDGQRTPPTPAPAKGPPAGAPGPGRANPHCADRPRVNIRFGSQDDHDG